MGRSILAGADPGRQGGAGLPHRCARAPDAVLLKKLTFKKEKQELLWQLARSKGVWARIEACKGLSRFVGDDEVAVALSKILAKDTFWGVRRAAASALGEIGGEAARDALIAGARGRDSRVRRDVYKALGKFRGDDTAFKALVKAYEEDGWYYPMNAAALALAETRHDKAFTTILKGMDRASQAEIVARGACMALANLRNEGGSRPSWSARRRVDPRWRALARREPSENSVTITRSVATT